MNKKRIIEFLKVWSKGEFSSKENTLFTSHLHGNSYGASGCGQNPILIISPERYGEPLESVWLLACFSKITKYDTVAKRDFETYIGVFSTSKGLIESATTTFIGNIFSDEIYTYKSNIHCLEETFHPHELSNGVMMYCNEFFVVVEKTSEVVFLCRRENGRTKIIIDKFNYSHALEQEK